MPFIVGENIGPYRITEQLGHGGMATVFKAYHAALDRYVALKALHPAFTVEQNFLDRFQREARVVARLEHPNIVPIYDFSEHEGRPYLVMKFIEGETLKARLGRGMLDWDELNKIVESVGAALAYAHHKGVLHRDIKPSNVLLANDGNIYLADFGLARIAEAGESTISSDVLLGTPQYISPEQALGKRDLDNGTDIYSFGVLLYELLVGRVPYSADTPYSVIHDHIYTPLPMPRSIRAEIPEAVERVLLKAMAKDRSDRFADIDSLLSAWRQALGKQPEAVAPILPPPATKTAVQGPPPATVKGSSASTVVLDEAQLAAGTPQTVKKKAGRAWLWLAAIILTVLCLVIAAIVLLTRPGLRSRLSPARDSTQTQAAAVTTAPVSMVTQPPSPTHTAAVKHTARPLQPTALPKNTTARPTLPRPLQPQEQVTPISLEAAQERVEADPQNPLAHVELAVAYLNAGQSEKAHTEWNSAKNLAGNKIETYIAAGKIFSQHRQMLFAAEAFSIAASLSPTPSEELLNALKQTLYMAASDPDFSRFMASAELSPLEPEFLEIVNGRNQLLVQKDLQSAKRVVNKFSTGQIKFIEVKLLEAEILWEEGQKMEARGKLRVLSLDVEAPLWVRNLAEMILRENFR